MPGNVESAAVAKAVSSWFNLWSGSMRNLHLSRFTLLPVVFDRRRPHLRALEGKGVGVTTYRNGIS